MIRWEAEGDLAIAMEREPPADGNDQCTAKGRDTIALTLVARKGGKDEQSSDVEVVQLGNEAAEPVVLGTDAVEGKVVVARGEKSVGLWGERVEVVTVAACRNRKLQVTHEGRQAWLAPDGAPSDAFAGTSLSGTWELRSPLAAKEQSTPSLRPKQLALLATIRCKPEAQ